MSKDKYAFAQYGALYIKTKVKQIQQFFAKLCNTYDVCTVSLNPKSHTFTTTGSNCMNKSGDSLWITRKWNTREELAKYELVVAIWQWWAGAPFPSTAHRMGPVKTVISQTKLMWTSGARFTYSPTRLSSLWLPAHLENAALPLQDSSISTAS